MANHDDSDVTYRLHNADEDVDRGCDSPAEAETGYYADDTNGDKIKDFKNSRRKMGRPRKRKRAPSPDNLSRPNSVDNEHFKSKSPTVNGDKIISPLPEDLSIRSLNNGIDNSRGSTPADNENRESPIHEAWDRSGSVASTSNSVSNVRDLEQAMNKHLPAYSTSNETESTYNEYPTSQSPKHRSTIQWVGSQQPQQPEPLPASTLLRHLQVYANRESVIRTNIYNQSRPQYYSDMQSSMLTPPNDTYKDQSPFTAPQSKSPMNSMYPITSYPNAHAGYSITPPTSVSPHEKYTSPFSEASFTDSNSNQLKFYSDGVTQAMPIKPQAYPLSGAVYDRNASQYSKFSYYGSSGYNPYAQAGLTEDHFRKTSTNYQFS